MSEPRLTERPLLTRARIGVLMGGQSAERDVSLRTGAAVHRSLVRRGYNAVAIDVGATLSQDLYDQKICGISRLARPRRRGWCDSRFSGNHGNSLYRIRYPGQRDRHA